MAAHVNINCMLRTDLLLRNPNFLSKEGARGEIGGVWAPILVVDLRSSEAPLGSSSSSSTATHKSLTSLQRQLNLQPWRLTLTIHTPLTRRTPHRRQSPKRTHMPPPSRPWALVSPASRGIGRALARHLLQTTRVPVVATARGDVNEARDGILKELGDVVGRGARNNNAEERLKVLKLDVCGEQSRKPHHSNR